ncbi:MAG TPA: ATP-binding protein, partial [Candidatus Parcubacteria bacterium]|nr:ATP-binding protein [Candidatus Parcubacteria bacterium]
MLSRIYSAGLLGLEARIIEIEVDASYGMRHFNIVGLPDKAIEESKERIGSALQNSGFLSPQKRPIRVLVSLAPADLKKEGSLYDLPIALACLLSTQQASFETEKKLFLGELNLQGKLRPIKGVLSAALLAKKENFQEIILPKENAKEACLVKGLKITPLENLREAVDYLEKRKEISFSASPKNLFKKEVDYSLDFSYIRGQEYAKRALEIVAAGSH